MKKIPLHWQIIIGMLLGVVWSVISSYAGWSDFTIKWINPWGEIFLKLLKLIAVPLVLFSIIAGISSLSNITKLSRIGIKTLGFYLTTTFVAVIIGLSLVNTIQPGNLIDPEIKVELSKNMEESIAKTGGNKKIMDKQADAESFKKGGLMGYIKEQIFPDNIFLAMASKPVPMLQIIFFAIFFGVALMLIPAEKAKPVKSLIDGLNEVILSMVHLIMKAAPFFVFALMAGLMAKMVGNNPSYLLDIFEGLGYYALTVVLGLTLLIFGVYPFIVHFIVRKLPIREFFRGIGQAQLVAFSTSSSAATLPVTMDCVNQNLGVSKDVTGFVLPIGATVNMDGTSLYQGITVVFLAQFFGAGLEFSDQIIIMFTAVLASIGAPAVPSAGLVLLIIVLGSVGLPEWWIALVFPIDRPLDMMRTVVNVTGDATAASLIAKTENELNYQAA